MFFLLRYILSSHLLFYLFSDKGYVSEACCGVLKKEADVTVFDPLGMDLMVHVAEV